MSKNKLTINEVLNLIDENKHSSNIQNTMYEYLYIIKDNSLSYDLILHFSQTDINYYFAIERFMLDLINQNDFENFLLITNSKLRIYVLKSLVNYLKSFETPINKNLLDYIFKNNLILDENCYLLILNNYSLNQLYLHNILLISIDSKLNNVINKILISFKELLSLDEKYILLKYLINNNYSDVNSFAIHILKTNCDLKTFISLKTILSASCFNNVLNNLISYIKQTSSYPAISYYLGNDISKTMLNKITLENFYLMKNMIKKDDEIILLYNKTLDLIKRNNLNEDLIAGIFLLKEFLPSKYQEILQNKDFLIKKNSYLYRFYYLKFIYNHNLLSTERINIYN